jgi:hypothetical protein
MVYSDLGSTWNPERKRKQRKDGLVCDPILLGVEKEKYLYNIAAVSDNHLHRKQFVSNYETDVENTFFFSPFPNQRKRNCYQSAESDNHTFLNQDKYIEHLLG